MQLIIHLFQKQETLGWISQLSLQVRWQILLLGINLILQGPTAAGATQVLQGSFRQGVQAGTRHHLKGLCSSTPTETNPSDHFPGRSKIVGTNFFDLTAPSTRTFGDATPPTSLIVHPQFLVAAILKIQFAQVISYHQHVHCVHPKPWMSPAHRGATAACCPRRVPGWQWPKFLGAAPGALGPSERPGRCGVAVGPGYVVKHGKTLF